MPSPSPSLPAALDIDAGTSHRLAFGPLRRRLCLAAALAATGLPLSARAGGASSCPALLNRQAPRLQDEKPQDLCQYAGKLVVVVNTASFCGYTPQYQALETLYSRYQARGLVVLGFPSNDFGAQEPGSNRDIAAFCENTFGVKFPMFAKTRVAPNGSGPVDPLFVELRQRTGQAPGWNFHKYLIARNGRDVQSFSSDTTPLDPRFVAAVENGLAQPAR